MGPLQVLPLRARVKLGVMTIKGSSKFIFKTKDRSSDAIYGHTQNTPFFQGGGLTHLHGIQSAYSKPH